MPASYVQYRHAGDKYNAKRLNHFGFAQLEILRNAMRFQGLMQNKRIVEFASGIRVVCTSVFGIDTINIYVPPLLPVLEKDVIVEEEYCWCSTYFTEGKIIEVIDPDILEGGYDYSNGGLFYYYRILITSRLFDTEYTGKRYLVQVCRGVKQKVLICHALDLGIYQVGDGVILFCTGNYFATPYTIFHREYTWDPAFSDASCIGKANLCFSCQATLSPPVGRGLPGDIDGTYAIIAISAEPKPIYEDTIVDVTTYKQISLTELEKDCIEVLELPKVPGLSGVYYGDNGKYFFGMDFIAKELVFKYNDSLLTVGIHFNCQSPLSYKDRMRTVIYLFEHALEAIILKVGTEYTLISYRRASTIRCPNEALQFDMFKYANYNYTDRSKVYFNLDSLIELDTVNNVPALCVVNGYRPILVAEETVENSISHTAASERTPILEDDIEIGYTITASSEGTSKIIAVKIIREEEPAVNEYTYSAASNSSSTVYYHVSSVSNSYQHTEKRPIVYTVPEYMVEINTPRYAQANNIPIIFSDYTKTYAYSGSRTDQSSSMRGNGQYLTIYTEGLETETIETQYFDANGQSLFTETIQKNMAHYGLSIVEAYLGTIAYTNEVLFATTICAGLYNTDFTIRVYNIFVTKSYSFTRSLDPDSWEGNAPGVYWIDSNVNETYKIFVTLFKKEVTTERIDLSAFKITDCEIITSGEEVDWIKEKFLDYIDEYGDNFNSVYTEIYNCFAVPNE